MTRIGWMLVLALVCACDSKKAEQPAAEPASPAAPAAKRDGPILSDALVDAYVKAREDGADNPYDSVCADKVNKPGALTARYNTLPDGVKVADAWVKKHGFRDFAHYREVTTRILNAQGVVTMRETDPGYKPTDPLPEEDIALVAKHDARIDAANAAANTRRLSGDDCK